jgi:hypothetical protein
LPAHSTSAPAQYRRAKPGWPTDGKWSASFPKLAEGAVRAEGWPRFDALDYSVTEASRFSTLDSEEMPPHDLHRRDERHGSSSLLMIKTICFFILACLLGTGMSAGAGSTNWPPVGYTQVRAYLYNLDGVDAAPILEKGKLAASVTNRKGVALTKAQIAVVQKAVADFHPHTLEFVAGCYRPRHGFVYYDTDHRPVGFVEICFSCRGYRTSPPSTGPMDLETLEKLFRDLNIPVLDTSEDYLSLKGLESQ